MHIKTKETFPNMLRNCRFTFSTCVKKMVLKWDSNQHQFWQCSLMNWLSTNWANQVHAIRQQFYITLMISSVKHGSLVNSGTALIVNFTSIVTCPYCTLLSRGQLIHRVLKVSTSFLNVSYLQKHSNAVRYKVDNIFGERRFVESLCYQIKPHLHSTGLLTQAKTIEVIPYNTGCPRMFYTVFQKNIKNITSTMSLIMIHEIECLIYALTTVKISFTHLYPLRCDMVSLKIDE